MAAGAAVAATSCLKTLGGALLVLGVCLPLGAAVLPEDRTDLLYHSYEGGGVEITGPSVLVRKQFAEKVSVWGNYYVDAVSSASIDVVTTASAYTEERTEKSLGADYLTGKAIMSLSYTQSVENDYEANTAAFSVSQDFFGDLTTLTMGYAQGWDTVGQRGNDAFEEEVERRHYRLGLTQVLTKSMLVGLSYEMITDEGFLNNPYRQVRYADPLDVDGNGRLYEYQFEVYPNTRTSNALALRALYYLPYRAALRAEYRVFTDTWGIDADSVELAYVHPFRKNWVLEAKIRRYQQTAASFYSDLFPYQDAQTHLARDKELSTFSSQALGLGVTYEFEKGWGFIDRASLNLNWDYMRFDYEDFRDLREGTPTPGTEPLYSFDANVLKLFLSIWY